MPAVDELVRTGRAAGLDAVGVCTAAPFVATRAELERRRAAGLHGGMDFTFRNPAYSTTPQLALRDAAALVVGALAYRRREPPEPEPDRPYARVASYAWEEYYAPLKDALGAVSAALRAEGWRSRIVVDDNALVDRAAAVRAGLGWPGRSGNVLLPGRGSWFVVEDPAPVPDGCGTCRRCHDGCPTGAIVAPGVVDARRCLSWLLQQPGTFPPEHRVALGDRIYGCDDCQEVCPPNRRDDRVREPVDAGLGARARVDVVDLLEADDDTLLARHGRWYLHERDPRWLRRNALVVLANTAPVAGDPAAAPALAARVRAVLARALTGTDPMLAAHAVWAARRLGHHDLVALIAPHAAPEVAAACAGPVPPRTPEP